MTLWASLNWIFTRSSVKSFEEFLAPYRRKDKEIYEWYPARLFVNKYRLSRLHRADDLTHITQKMYKDSIHERKGKLETRTLTRSHSMKYGLIKYYQASTYDTKWLGRKVDTIGSHTVFTSRKGSGSREFGVVFIMNNNFKQLVHWL